MYESVPANAVWQYDHIENYRLDEEIINGFLLKKWGKYKYFVKRVGEEFRFWVPRSLTQDEKYALLELRKNKHDPFSMGKEPSPEEPPSPDDGFAQSTSPSSDVIIECLPHIGQYSHLPSGLPSPRQNSGSRSDEQPDKAISPMFEPINQHDTETISAGSSYQPSIFSVDSTKSSLNSNSLSQSMAEHWLAVTELKAMLAADAKFSSLCRMAMKSRSIDIQKFERNLSRIIRNFANGLKQEAAFNDKGVKAAARVIRSLAKLLAMEIVRTFTSETSIKTQIDGAKLSERHLLRELESSLAPRFLIEDDNDDEDEDEDEDEDLADFPNILQVKAFILSSKAFKNMRWALHWFLQPNVSETVSEEMMPELGSEEPHTVTFYLRWNLLRFCEEELEGNSKLATVLTVTGSGRFAYATTCQQYVDQYWPETGQLVLKLLESAMHRRTSEMQTSWGLTMSMDLSAWHSPAKDDIAIVRVFGLRKYLIHIAQQLAWISAVFRVPRDDELSYSDIMFEKAGSLQFNLQLMDLQKVKNTHEHCWHSLFVSSVIARGFAIPSRDQEIGIEIPFEVMNSLACVLYPMDYMGGTILRGIKLTLVPTAYRAGSLQWHCVSSDQDCYLPRADEVMKQIPEWYKTTDFELLKNARTFLGYCEIAEVHVGTSGTDYGRIHKSKARTYVPRLEVSRELTANLGVSAKGIITATLSPKFTLSRGLRVTTQKVDLFFEDRLLSARYQPSLLYGVEKKQGWLVPELSVILHIAHAWASRQPDLPAEVLEKIPYAEASPDGGAAAWDAILKGKEVELRKGTIDGKPQLFGDVINNVLAAMASRKDSAVVKDENTLLNFHSAARKLRGWELVDVVQWNYLSERKAVDIDRKTAGDWGLIASENPDLMVFFSDGLGQLIRPAKGHKVCRLWAPIPEDLCYLTASIPCLKRLLEKCGGSEARPKLTRRLHWHRPEGASLFEGCSHGIGNACNRLQQLVVEKKAITPGHLEPHGAAIFGKMGQIPKTRGKAFKTPREGQRDDISVQCVTPHQIEESPRATPGAVLDQLSESQIEPINEHDASTQPQQISLDRLSHHGSPNAGSQLPMDKIRTLQVRPKFNDLRPNQRRESTK